MNLLRFLLVCVLLSGTTVFLRCRDRQEILAPRQQLASFPSQFGPWKGTDVSISAEVREVLGHGDFLSRIYRDNIDNASYVDLFIAYFPSQRFGDTIHSPKNCLPGSGWVPLESGRVTLSVPEHEPFSANRSIIAKGNDHLLVLYWYLAHDRPVASEYWARYYLFADSVRLNRTDGSLIRLITPLQSGEAVDLAQQRLVSLAAQVLPVIDLYVPR
jgi:EpsI family protein